MGWLAQRQEGPLPRGGPNPPRARWGGSPPSCVLPHTYQQDGSCPQVVRQHIVQQPLGHHHPKLPPAQAAQGGAQGPCQQDQGPHHPQDEGPHEAKEEGHGGVLVLSQQLADGHCSVECVCGWGGGG